LIQQPDWVAPRRVATVAGAMTRRSWLALIATAAVWGSSYLFIKVALRDFSEGAIVCIRTALGAALLLSVAARRGVLGEARARARWIALIALIQVVGPFLLITYGENHVSSSLTAILISTVPIFTALLALGFDPAERSQGWALVGIVVGIVGVAMLFGVDLSGSRDELAGGAMMLAAALGYAISWLLVKHKLAGAPPVAVAGGTMLVATLLTAPLLVASPPAAAPALDAIGSLLALGAGGTGVAFVLYYTLIADIGPARASMVGYVAPAFSIVYGVVLLGEDLTLAAVGGLALILAGSWLGAQGRPPWRRASVSRSEPSRSSAPAPARAR
jgi:drug/metabolite transporter (DMT)-like permease